MQWKIKGMFSLKTELLLLVKTMNVKSKTLCFVFVVDVVKIHHDMLLSDRSVLCYPELPIVYEDCLLYTSRCV